MNKYKNQNGMECCFKDCRKHGSFRQSVHECIYSGPEKQHSIPYPLRNLDPLIKLTTDQSPRSISHVINGKTKMLEQFYCRGRLSKGVDTYDTSA